MNEKPHNHISKSGVYEGIEWIAYYHILDRDRNGGLAFYCGYIKVPEDHPWIQYLDKKKWYDIGLSGWKMRKMMAKKEGKPFDEPKPRSNRRYTSHYEDIDISVHGGLTFGQKISAGTKEIEHYKKYQGFTPGYWIGWDYGHAGDYNHDKEWWEKLLQSDDPSSRKMGQSFMDLDKKFEENWKAKGFDSALGRERDWTLEEVIKECELAIMQLKGGYSESK